MRLWCSSPFPLHHRARDHRASVCRRFRSTKGASKARRDHINHEIRNMRALLPISQEDQERLSYLHSMAAICTYFRKSLLLHGLPAGEGSHSLLPYEAFLQALHGFILVTTAKGKLVYVSENVADYLGFSMIDVLQGDTIYDMVERSDVDIVRANLETDSRSSSERSFICCMQTSKAFKMQHGGCCSMLVRGNLQRIPQPHPSRPSTSASSELLFVAFCTPTANRLAASPDRPASHSFSSAHRMDMSFTQASDSVFHLLGYTAEGMTGRSWYSLVHPEDLSASADSHRSLVQADEGLQVEMVLRLQRVDLSWTWIYIRANKDSEYQSIRCTNVIVSEIEARFLREKVSSDAFRPACLPNSCQATHQAPPTQSHSSKGFKRQRTSHVQQEEPSVRCGQEPERDVYYVAYSSSQGDSSPVPLGDSPTFFTPPYSPASSSSPFQQEEVGRDLLMDVHEHRDQLLSSPESSPSYYSYPEAGFTCQQSPSNSLPAAAEQTFDQAAFSSLSPLSSSSPTFDFQPCTSDTRLVPDCLSASDVCESPVEYALHPDDFGLLDQPQGGGFVQLHHVPQLELPSNATLQTPNQSPTSTEANPYSEREQAEISILAQQISSLASSFDLSYSLNPLQQHGCQSADTSSLSSAYNWTCDRPFSSVLPPKQEPLLDGVFDSILKDLDMVPRKSSASTSAGTVSPSCQQGLLCSKMASEESEQAPLSFTSEDLLSAQQFTVDSFSMQLGHHAQNPGLHQLNHYMQSNLLQDGLTEENLY